MKNEEAGDGASKNWVRLSVNISFDVAGALRELSRRHGTSATEEIRRAISMAKFIDDEVRDGNKLLVMRGDTLVEVMLL